MTINATGIQQLHAVFKNVNISSTSHSDHLVVKGSKTDKQIRGIVESAGFCPLVSEGRTGGRYIVSMIPYRDFYMTFEEVSGLFKKSIFSNGVDAKDLWDDINAFRKMVLLALNQGISEIVEKSAKKDLPIIEIGSGIGYSLSEKVSSMTIKTQTSARECQLLSKSTKAPIYQLDIEGIYKGLSENGKKVPLFFALNVFDTLSPSVRKASFLQLSQLQYSGDRILMMLDSNPFLERSLESLHSLYPEHAIFPYFLAETGFSVILVPLDKAPFNPSLKDFLECMDMEANARVRGGTSELQGALHVIQKKYDLKVINLEEFFTHQVQQELEEVGYESNVYYHASFALGQARVTQDVVYKRVTDIFTVREWCPTDEKFIGGLKHKGLKLPDHIDNNFLHSMRMKGQKILGAEILVIEANKK